AARGNISGIHHKHAGHGQPGRQFGRGRFEQNSLAGWMAKAKFESAHFLARKPFVLEQAPHRRQLFLRQAVLEALSLEDLRRIAKDPQTRRADIEDHSILSQNDNEIGGILDEGTKMGFALPYGVIKSFELFGAVIEGAAEGSEFIIAFDVHTVIKVAV